MVAIGLVAASLSVKSARAEHHAQSSVYYYSNLGYYTAAPHYYYTPAPTYYYTPGPTYYYTPTPTYYYAPPAYYPAPQPYAPPYDEDSFYHCIGLRTSKRRRPSAWMNRAPGTTDGRSSSRV